MIEISWALAMYIAYNTNSNTYVRWNEILEAGVSLDAALGHGA